MEMYVYEKVNLVALSLNRTLTVFIIKKTNEKTEGLAEKQLSNFGGML